MLFQFCSIIPSMEVETYLQETGKFRMLDEGNLRGPVERRLREALLFSEKGTEALAPVLRVAVIKHDRAYNVAVIFKRPLRGIHATRWLKSAVWEIQSVGTVQSPEVIYMAIMEGVEFFLSEYLRTQGSPECAVWKDEGWTSMTEEEER